MVAYDLCRRTYFIKCTIETQLRITRWLCDAQVGDRDIAPLDVHTIPLIALRRNEGYSTCGLLRLAALGSTGVKYIKPLLRSLCSRFEPRPEHRNGE